jgi:hypothetical protein
MAYEYLSDIDYYDYRNHRFFDGVNVAAYKATANTALRQIHKLVDAAIASDNVAAVTSLSQIHKFASSTSTSLADATVSSISQIHNLNADTTIAERTAISAEWTQIHELNASGSTRYNSVKSTLVFPSEYYVEDGSLYAICGSNPDVAIVGVSGPEVSLTYTSEAMTLVDGYLILTT